MPEERVFVACDQCGRPVPTGLFIDPSTLAETQDRFGENRTKCPTCDHWIVWSRTRIWPESVVLQRFGKLPGTGAEG